MPDPTPAALHTSEPPLLQTVGLTKRYGSFLANEAIAFLAGPRAGKSTGNVLNVDGGVTAAYPR